MPTGKPVGTAYAELDLDLTKYEKGLKRAYERTVEGTEKFEASFKRLGISSDRMYESQKQLAIASYNAIKNSSKSTTDDILRAEKAKNERIKQLNDEQYGQQKSILSAIREDWMKAAAAIVAAWYAIKKAVDAVSAVVMRAARYETLGVVMRVVGENAGYSSRQMAEFQSGLERAGISMIEARQGLARMNQAHLDLAKSAQLARVAQDAAVIGAMNSSEAFNQMVYGIQSANVRVLRTIGINVSFEDSYQKVAEQLGRTTTSFTEAEKANIRLNAVLKAGEAIAGSYEASMETAGKQLYSLERHFDNLKVLGGAAFTPALLEIVQAVTGGVVDINKELSGEKASAIEDWGINLRIALISVEAEIMRLAMLVDKFGGTWTSMKMLLYGPGAALGIESSTKRFEAAADANMEFEQRYEDTSKALEELARKQLDLEYDLTAAGKARRAAEKEKANTSSEAVAAIKKGLLEEQEAEQKALGELQKRVAFSREARKTEIQLLKEKAEAINKANITAIAAWEKEAEAERKANEEKQKAIGLTEDYVDLWQIQARDRYEVQNRSLEAIEELEKAKFSSLVKLSERTANAMEQNFSDLFFNIMRRKFEDLADVGSAVLESLQRMTADLLGQWAKAALFGESPGTSLGGVFGSLAGAVAGLFTSSTSSIHIGAGGTSAVGMAGGGVINEPVAGVGLRTGMSYSFGENEQEIVVPSSKLSGGTSSSTPTMSVKVEIVNESGQKMQISDSQARFNLQDMVVTVWLDAFGRNYMGMREALAR